MKKLTHVAGLGVVLAVLSAGLTAHEAESAPVRFMLDAQPLRVALNQWAEQAGLSVVLPAGQPGVERVTAKVQGEYSPRQALDLLLEGSGLTYAFVDEKTVAIREKSRPDQKPAAATSTFGTLRMARADESFAAASASGETSSTSAAHTNVPGLEEVLVTAQKRMERLVDVPISIVALSEAELQRRKTTSIDDLAMAVPGLTIQSSGSFQRRISIRGISSFFGSSSLIGAYLDEASVTSNPAFQLDLRTYDLERVEVLRGPQGTLYGEGSVGGTLRFITRNPDLTRFSLRADMAALFTEDGAPGQRIEGVVNIPVVEDELGFRITGVFDHQGGWIEQPAADKRDFNDQNLAHVRAKGRWKPSDQLTVDAMAVIHRNDAPPNIGEDADGNLTQVFGLTLTPSGEDQYDISNLTVTYDFDAVRVLSTTTYIDQDKEIRNLGSLLQLADPVLGLPPFHYLQFLQASSSRILSQELRLMSQGSGPWQWTVGGFYRRHRYELEGLYSFGFPPLPGVPLPAPFPLGPVSDLSESVAVFGDTSYKLTDNVTLGVGLRYFEDDKESTTAGIFQADTFDAFNPRVYLQYGLGENANVYASAAKGFRSGGFNQLNQPVYDPESVLTYELGIKTALAGGRASAEVALFHSDYEDYQIFGIVPAPSGELINVTSNAGDARIRGVDVALSWFPTESWTLGLNGNYVDSEFVKIVAQSSSHAAGDSLDLVPKYNVAFSLQRELLLKSRPGFIRVDYGRQDRSSYRVRSNGPWYYSESDIIDTLNANLNVQWTESLSWGFFAQNLLNDRGRIDPLAIIDAASRARPRTFGLQFGVSFD